MEPFPKTAEDFYRKRDDRTNRCTTAAYQQVHCVVTADVRTMETFAGQVILLTACNLLSRWCRRVSIIIPNLHIDERINASSPPIAQFILAQMHDADPFGFFEVINSDAREPDIQLHIGEGLRSCAPRCVVISASGWLASISGRGGLVFPTANGPNFIGALAAACLGVAQVFKLAVGLPENQLIAEGAFDLFTLSRMLRGQSISDHDYVFAPEIGKLLMVGAGSVASAAAYAIRLMNASCDLSIVDRDSVKIENFSRSPIFGKRTYGLPKVDALATYFSGTAVIPATYNMWWNEFVKKLDRQSSGFDVWLPLANEFGVRWSMQNNYPPLLVHASTTNNWGVNHGRHRFQLDDCLIDRFPAELAPDALGCSTGTVESETEHVDAALPFLSMFAGVLVAAELARLQLPDYPQARNFALIDFGGTISEIQSWDMKARSSCSCQTQSATIHKTLNGKTKYFDTGIVVVVPGI